MRRYNYLLFLVSLDSELIHPVKKQGAGKHFAFFFTADAGEKRSSSNQKRWIHSSFFCFQKIGPLSFLSVFNTVNFFVVKECFYDTRAFSAVDLKLFPGFTL